MYLEPCPICGQLIPEIRAIVYECEEHGEFTTPEVNRVKFEKTKEKIKTVRKAKKRVNESASRGDLALFD
jgi:hypothetical protein